MKIGSFQDNRPLSKLTGSCSTETDNRRAFSPRAHTDHPWALPLSSSLWLRGFFNRPGLWEDMCPASSSENQY